MYKVFIKKDNISIIVGYKILVIFANSPYIKY